MKQWIPPWLIASSLSLREYAHTDALKRKEVIEVSVPLREGKDFSPFPPAPPWAPFPVDFPQPAFPGTQRRGSLPIPCGSEGIWWGPG